MKSADQLKKELNKFKDFADAVYSAHEYAIELSQNKGAIAEAEKVLADKRAGIEEVKKELAAIKKSADEELQSIKSKCKSLIDNESEKVASKKEEFANVCKALDDKVKSVDAEISGKNKVSASIDAEIAEKQNSVKDLEDKIETMKAKVLSFIE